MGHNDSQNLPRAVRTVRTDTNKPGITYQAPTQQLFVLRYVATFSEHLSHTCLRMAYGLLHTSGWTCEDQMRSKMQVLRILLATWFRQGCFWWLVSTALDNVQSMLLWTHIHIGYLRLPQQPYKETGWALWSPCPLSAPLLGHLEY
jgi:hypothetical protein